MISAGEFRNGVTFEQDGQVLQVVEFQHVKPGKGAAFVRTKTKNVITGSVVETSYNPTAKFPQAFIERKDVTYSYEDGDLYHFMDNETYDDIPVNASDVPDNFKFCKENELCKLLSYKGKVFSVEIPNFIELEVTQTEPGVKGNTATNTLKPATVETGAEIRVPLFINPMDINANYSEEDNPLSLKADFILSLCELVVGGKEGLLPVEKTVIDRCVHLIYRKYFADPCPENMPILEDLYNALLQQDEKEAHHVATALEIYVKGSLNLFNHRTNVNVNNRIVCYDIKELGKQMKKLGMLIVQDQVWGRVTANRSSGKSTRYYMDEMHLLLKEEQTAAYSVEIWKRFRKWGGVPTGLTQNVKDLLSSREVENIFENSDMIIMLNQAAGDRQILAKQLNISPHQLSYVTHSGEGEGLLFFGNVILPFVDRFPTDLELYRIMTTKLGEVSEGKKE